MLEAVVVEPSTTIQDASATMLDEGADAAIVVDAGEAYGLVTAEDVARALAAGHDATVTPIHVIADRDPLLARVDEALAEVHQRMRGGERPLAIVVDSSGAPVGLLRDLEAAP